MHFHLGCCSGVPLGLYPSHHAYYGVLLHASAHVEGYMGIHRGICNPYVTPRVHGHHGWTSPSRGVDALPPPITTRHHVPSYPSDMEVWSGCRCCGVLTECCTHPISGLVMWIWGPQIHPRGRNRGAGLQIPLNWSLLEVFRTPPNGGCVGYAPLKGAKGCSIPL